MQTLRDGNKDINKAFEASQNGLSQKMGEFFDAMYHNTSMANSTTGFEKKTINKQNNKDGDPSKNGKEKNEGGSVKGDVPHKNVKPVEVLKDHRPVESNELKKSAEPVKLAAKSNSSHENNPKENVTRHNTTMHLHPANAQHPKQMESNETVKNSKEPEKVVKEAEKVVKEAEKVVKEQGKVSKEPGKVSNVQKANMTSKLKVKGVTLSPIERSKDRPPNHHNMTLKKDSNATNGTSATHAHANTTAPHANTPHAQHAPHPQTEHLTARKNVSSSAAVARKLDKSVVHSVNKNEVVAVSPNVKKSDIPNVKKSDIPKHPNKEVKFCCLRFSSCLGGLNQTPVLKIIIDLHKVSF